MEEQLRNFFFFHTCAHSCLVNLNEVKKYVRGEGGYLIMTDGSSVNVSVAEKKRW